MIAENVLRSRYSRRISVFFVLLLLIFLSFPIISVADEEVTSSYLPTDYIQSIIDNTPATNPALFDEAISDPKTVAIAGTIPAFSQGEDAYRWSLVLQGVLKKINNESLLAPYQWDNGGFVIGYGCPSDHIQIFVNSDSEYTDEDIAEVIKVIQDAGKEAGITDLPVIVEIGTHAQGFVPANASAPQGEIKTIPGVGLGISALLVVAVVLSARKLKK